MYWWALTWSTFVVVRPWQLRASMCLAGCVSSRRIWAQTTGGTPRFCSNLVPAWYYWAIDTYSIKRRDLWEGAPPPRHWQSIKRTLNVLHRRCLVYPVRTAWTYRGWPTQSFVETILGEGGGYWTTKISNPSSFAGDLKLSLILRSHILLDDQFKDQTNANVMSLTQGQCQHRQCVRVFCRSQLLHGGGIPRFPLLANDCSWDYISSQWKVWWRYVSNDFVGPKSPSVNCKDKIPSRLPFSLNLGHSQKYLTCAQLYYHDDIDPENSCLWLVYHRARDIWSIY